MPLKASLDFSTPSSLAPNQSGIVELLLVQAASGRTVVGSRLALTEAQSPVHPTANQVADCRSLLNETKVNTLTVFSFHPGLIGCQPELRALALDRTVVGLAGIDQEKHNCTYIASSGKLVVQAKLSLSSEDNELAVIPGCELNVFIPVEGADAVRWAVLNCHDYTHVDLMRLIQEQGIELLIVVTYNVATRLFWEYAIADIHRLFCYIVVANVAELGGSAVFAPYRRIGNEENARLGVGGQVFGVRGPSQLRVAIPLDIRELRKLRSEFIEHGFKAKKLQRLRGNSYWPVMPPEHFLNTFDRSAQPPILKEVLDIPIEWNFARPRVAVTQLHHIGLHAYIDSRYRIRRHETCGEFEQALSMKLLELESRCRHKGKTAAGTLLDLLVFPEVFIPRSFLSTLQGYSDRTGSVIVAGLDYPGDKEEDNANECIIMIPNQESKYYRKITRSQYDAHRSYDGDLMPMQRGTQLLRFVSNTNRGFGVLICYDFSHMDLMWALNLTQRRYPLDITVIVAHNPFGELYRSCCIADAHRFYQYIVMSNVAEYGGSGIFCPTRTVGARQTLLEAGKGVETIALAELNLEGLWKARQTEDSKLHKGGFMRRPGLFQDKN